MIYIYWNHSAFEDIVQGLSEAIQDLGFQVEIISKIIDPSYSDLYIMFGLNKYQGPLPPKYIAYQLEQTGENLGRNWFKKKYIKLLRNAVSVWDYSIKNIQNLKQYGIRGVEYVPFAYMLCLDNISRVPESEKDIDVLFYGSSSIRRENIMTKLKEKGLKIYFGGNNLWGEKRNQLISRSKIVLNIHYYKEPILETTRLSHLITNQSFVISEKRRPNFRSRIFKIFNFY